MSPFLDLHKTFDSLDHCILLQWLFDLGVGSQALLWVKHYLSDCVHWVKAGDQYSDWSSMCAGIIRGRALGAVLDIYKHYRVENNCWIFVTICRSNCIYV